MVTMLLESDTLAQNYKRGGGFSVKQTIWRAQWKVLKMDDLGW